VSGHEPSLKALREESDLTSPLLAQAAADWPFRVRNQVSNVIT
jgi:hypothetical protein